MFNKFGIVVCGCALATTPLGANLAENYMINWDLIIAVSGLLIALAASVATIWQGVLTRKHNKLSVKPFLRIDRLITSGNDVKVAMINSGVGPAIFNSLKLKVGSEIFDGNDATSWDIVINKVLPQKYRVRYFIPYKNEMFSAGESHNLFELPASGLTDEEYPFLLNAFQRISFIISYSSIYEEETVIEL